MSETFKHPFKIDFLDHVAIRVSDLKTSVRWYERILGLKRYQFEAWGAYPIFMLAGKTGVAIFPANTNKEQAELHPKKAIAIDHFAFNITNKAFDAAHQHFTALDLSFSVEDHHFFKSLYTKDPDGHKVELTTLIVREDEFYNK